MFTSEQYRAKANEYLELQKTANHADEVREFYNLERSFTELADNAKWVTDNYERTLHPSERSDASGVTLEMQQAQSAPMVQRSLLH